MRLRDSIWDLEGRGSEEIGTLVRVAILLGRTDANVMQHLRFLWSASDRMIE